MPNSQRRQARRAVLAALLASCAGWLAPTAQAGPWEQLLMPGPVISGHAKFETECVKCHEQFDKGGQQRLCLGCHDKVAADIESRTGFHGRSPAVLATECRHCHTDHKGRDEDIVRLDAETFDHSYARFGLGGAHARVACTSCHTPQTAYRDTPSDCASCHDTRDVHGGRLGVACADCHSDRDWNDAPFDHGETEFPLKGKHAEVACLQCHIDRGFQGAPTRCVACHRLNDVHAGGYGEDCAACHNSRDWLTTSFDHDRETRFALRGRHARIECAACHRPGAAPDSVQDTCIGCHRKDDAHRGRFGDDCARCHAQTQWSDVRFDHDTESGFPLTERHARVPCLACHEQPVKAGAGPRRCADCHGVDDVHKGELGGDCGRCHGVADWTRARFDHDLTRFPLIGLHALAPCENCHRSSRFDAAPSACIDCHAGDDAHEERLGRDCAQCHNPNGWRLWVFDHDARTDYPLDGAHRAIACTRCHRRPARDTLELPHECVACHAAQDVHGGRFGPVCERCHAPTSFRDLRVEGMRR